MFVAGTDTGVGKTLVSCAILDAVRRLGFRCIGLKPVAAGCELTDQGLRNEDALRLQECASETLKYRKVNPVAFASAIAPHIAAQETGTRLEAAALARGLAPQLERPVDLVIIEGAGGWRVPLNESETLADLVRILDLPVILVIGLKLGCLNHALLSAEAIRADGLELLAWAASCGPATMPRQGENIAALGARLDAPCLGILPWLGTPASASNAAGHLELSAIGF